MPPYYGFQVSKNKKDLIIWWKTLRILMCSRSGQFFLAPMLVIPHKVHIFQEYGIKLFFCVIKFWVEKCSFKSGPLWKKSDMKSLHIFLLFYLLYCVFVVFILRSYIVLPIVQLLPKNKQTRRWEMEKSYVLTPENSKTFLILFQPTMSQKCLFLFPRTHFYSAPKEPDHDAFLQTPILSCPSV